MLLALQAAREQWPDMLGQVSMSVGRPWQRHTHAHFARSTHRRRTRACAHGVLCTGFSSDMSCKQSRLKRDGGFRRVLQRTRAVLCVPPGPGLS